ncbi:hypothetical protein NXW52_05175 [Bacteroides ovatus]|nr:hypothetical protein NXW52_05175 [Bacteroides ovatus]
MLLRVNKKAYRRRMRALLFHAPAYTADGYDDTRPPIGEGGM